MEIKKSYEKVISMNKKVEDLIQKKHEIEIEIIKLNGEIKFEEIKIDYLKSIDKK